ncbi:hypothetical protein SK128_005591 [Halocaridina rubra]|uniref:Uncharacterized protein n=1 Tax=Halocaridina rubra TaxID=373956 RepID=A0AAN9A1Y3_HALRR
MSRISSPLGPLSRSPSPGRSSTLGVPSGPWVLTAKAGDSSDTSEDELRGLSGSSNGSSPSASSPLPRIVAFVPKTVQFVQLEEGATGAVGGTRERGAVGPAIVVTDPTTPETILGTKSGE